MKPEMLKKGAAMKSTKAWVIVWKHDGLISNDGHQLKVFFRKKDALESRAIDLFGGYKRVGRVFISGKIQPGTWSNSDETRRLLNVEQPASSGPTQRSNTKNRK